MRAPGEIWRQRLWIWVPALLFFLANAGAFAVYKLGFAGNIESLLLQYEWLEHGRIDPHERPGPIL